MAGLFSRWQMIPSQIGLPAIALALVLPVIAALIVVPAVAAVPFRIWLEELWVDAQIVGVSRPTFDAAFKGVTPNRKLPDLVTPRQKPMASTRQAEFTKTPERYLNLAYMRKLARKGRGLKARHSVALARISQMTGVPRSVILAIWGRETAFGTYRLRHYAIRALATQAYLGRRKDMFRKELLFALKMLSDKVATRADMRSSWAGALGLTQTMPSEYERMAVDMDGDGRRDIWRSVPDALGTAAMLLKEKGWIAGQSWGYEVTLASKTLASKTLASRTGANGGKGAAVDCAYEGPKQARSIADWERLGLRRTRNRAFSPELHNVSAYLMSPAGSKGPSFLVTENFTVIKRYNPSDLYALFVGHLADRVGGGADFAKSWAAIKQLPRSKIAEIQERLKGRGYGIGKVDGLIGSNTRAQIGLYQRREKLQVDCWPSKRILRHLQTVVANQ